MTTEALTMLQNALAILNYDAPVSSWYMDFRTELNAIADDYLKGAERAKLNRILSTTYVSTKSDCKELLGSAVIMAWEIRREFGLKGVGNG